MIIGFTGTRKGMSNAQRDAVWQVLQASNIEILIHGGCVGADHDFHNLGLSAAYGHIYVFPGHSAKNPTDLTYRADIKHDECVSFFESDTHFARNRRIVDSCNLMIACPLPNSRSGSGGTWYTIEYAKKVGRPMLIFDKHF